MQKWQKQTLRQTTGPVFKIPKQIFAHVRTGPMHTSTTQSDLTFQSEMQ